MNAHPLSAFVKVQNGVRNSQNTFQMPLHFIHSIYRWQAVNIQFSAPAVKTARREIMQTVWGKLNEQFLLIESSPQLVTSCQITCAISQGMVGGSCSR